MRIPDIAYRFSTAVDTSGPTVELFSRFQSVSASAAAVAVSILGIGMDRVLILTNIAVDLIPGATQGVLRLNVVANTPADLAFTITTEVFPGTADLRGAHVWDGEVMVGGGGVAEEIVNVAATFSAGVAANIAAVGLFGYVIPRGNVAPY